MTGECFLLQRRDGGWTNSRSWSPYFSGSSEPFGQAARVRAAGFDEDSPDEVGEGLDEAYYQLSGSEAARADLIRANPNMG
jgi:hypothetical protein